MKMEKKRKHQTETLDSSHNPHRGTSPTKRRKSSSSSYSSGSSYSSSEKNRSSREKEEGGKKKKANVEPNYKRSGLLAKAEQDSQQTQVVVGEGDEVQDVQVKGRTWFEPKDKRIPGSKYKWRLYPYKGEEPLEVVPIFKKSAYCFGRDRSVVDIPLDHISISKQHAVLQFRKVDGKLKPYIIDLNSANGTTLNNEPLPKSRYVELLSKDIFSFGSSTRKFLILCDDFIEEEEEDV